MKRFKQEKRIVKNRIKYIFDIFIKITWEFQKIDEMKNVEERIKMKKNVFEA